MIALILKAILVSLIVGFVTASIKTYIDRVFLMILSIFILRLPVADTITLNLLVMTLASFFFYARQEIKIRALPSNILSPLILSALAGAVLGRYYALTLNPKILAALLGLYAIGVGLRVVLVNITPQPDQVITGAVHPLALLWGIVTGLIAAGGKAFQVPMLVKWFKLSPNQAYMLASIGAASATIVAVIAQAALQPGTMHFYLFAWAFYFFASITVVSLFVERLWSPRLQQVVSYIISPLLILAGIRLIRL